MPYTYSPPVFQNKDTAELQEFIKKYPFATVISNNSTLCVSHLPLMLEDSGEFGTLVGHMAKGNNQWSEFDKSKPILCIFHGPHAYTSPTWYKKLPEVPTWNYAVVHAEGKPELITDKKELLSLVNKTIAHFEPSLNKPANKAFIPEPFKESQLDFIVGFKIKIDTLKGKFKLGQNRSQEDQQGIIKGLQEQKDPDSKQLSEFICRRSRL